MYDDPKSKISQLEKILDARGDLITKKTVRHELHDKETAVNQNWDQSEFAVGEEITSTPKAPKKFSLSLKILIGSIIFFLLALAVVAFRFFIGENLVSGNNIEINVKAPVSVPGGEVVPFELEIKNNNNVTLVGADLGITFPLGARDPADTSLPAKRVQSFLGDIAPGQTIKKNLSVALFGSENEKKELTLTLEYKVSGSNSLFTKTKKVSVLVTSAPISVVVTGPTEVNTNQTVNFTVEITSNSQSVVKDLLLQAEYPFGFTFLGSMPKNFSKDTLWLVGDLEPGAKRLIEITGILNGQEGEERGFNFTLGSQSASNSLAIETPFASSFSSVTIRRPFVSADISLNGSNSTEIVSSAGSKVEAIIKWRNNLSYEVSDVSISVKLNGNTLNKASVRADGGFYRSVDNTVIFNKATSPVLASLEPGQTGTSKFSFSSFGAETITGSALVNPVITLSLSVSGERVDYNGGQEDVLFSDARQVKISADPQLFAKALYYIGPFQNTGPIPPKAEQETSYTITWTVTNPLNSQTGGRVSAVLPPYVKWLGKVSPGIEKVDYDSGTGEVVWTVGNILAGAGRVAPAREVSFQISLLPSVSQIGASPNLIGEATLTARDNFTGTTGIDSFSALNIRLTNDPFFRVDDDTVLQ